MTYYIYKDNTGRWRWQLRDENQTIIAESGQAYDNKSDCIASISLVQASWRAPIYEL